MTVLVDTSVWSRAFRRSPKAPTSTVTTELAELVRQGRANIIGPIRQELLSGVKNASQFELLRDRLRAFPDVELEVQDFEDAADFSNRCRAKGIQGSSIDFLICAVASRRRLSIFTTDRDFEHFSTVVSIALHPVKP